MSCWAVGIQTWYHEVHFAVFRFSAMSYNTTCSVTEIYRERYGSSEEESYCPWGLGKSPQIK